MSQYIIRNATLDDFEGLHKIAKFLNSKNLPDDSKSLNELISKSIKSFSGIITDKYSRVYLFILEDLESKQIIGTSQIIAKHGTREAPHIYFEDYQDERYSESLDKLFHHRVLRLAFDYDGPTEVGGLVLLPALRLAPEKLGKQLSFVRFLFMGMNRNQFGDKVLAELLPPFEEGDKSLLWEALGKRFTGLEYLEADFLARENKEFIKGLFPEGPIYTSLFNENVQAMIGTVGPHSKAACHLLSSIGFQYSHHIDPFDGGPHYEAKLRDVAPINKAMKYKFKAERRLDTPSPKKGMFATWQNPFQSNAKFVSVSGEYSLSGPDEVSVSSKILELLELENGAGAFLIEF